MLRIPLPLLPALALCLVLGGLATSDAQVVFSSPAPGSVYREYPVTFSTGNDDWRVTDLNVNLTWYPQASAFLPNPTISFTIDDLSDAVGAEAVITVWGGHPGTTGKQVRFNGNGWITIPELNSSNGIPGGSDGQCFLSQYNVVVPVPLGNLQTGTNTVQGNSGGQTCYSFQWGQWGWYGIIIRVYYSSSKAHTEGAISSLSPGQTIGEFTTLGVGNLTGSVSRVDYLAYYDGVDTDGDGIYLQYHHDYHRDQGESMTIKNHAGTGTSGPSYSATWDATWVPDQSGIKLVARIRDGNGVWYVSPEITNITLSRSNALVRIYKPYNVPERMWARGDVSGGFLNCNTNVPDNLTGAVQAAMFVRTWNGIDADGDPGSYFGLNSWTTAPVGANHYYAMSMLAPPLSAVQSSNQYTFHSSTTSHHGIEILWPGPMLIVRWGEGAVPIELANFTWSTASGGGVRLIWNTISEINNYGFEVERSAANPDNFVALPNSFVPGAGTTLEPREYSWVDQDPVQGVAWYRLRQIDLDGTVTLTEPIRVDLLTEVRQDEVPSSYVLDQNFPNPFNPSTTITYGLPEPGVITLDVFSVTGKTVRTLVQGRKEAGIHSVTLDAADLPSGVYYYRLRAGNFLEVKRMTLVK